MTSVSRATDPDPWRGAWVWWSGGIVDGREALDLKRGPGEFDACPHCGSDQRDQRDDGLYRRTFMVEIRGLYDGGLFYECPDCGGRWHRWPEGHWLRAKATPYVDGGRYR